MFCGYCGNAVKEGARFCSGCGMQVKEAAGSSIAENFAAAGNSIAGNFAAANSGAMPSAYIVGAVLNLALIPLWFSKFINVGVSIKGYSAGTTATMHQIWQSSGS